MAGNNGGRWYGFGDQQQQQGLSSAGTPGGSAGAGFGMYEQYRASQVLESELHQFVREVCLSTDERSHHSILIKKLIAISQNCLDVSAQVHVFGSSASGLCEKASDVDATIKIDFSLLSLKFHGTLAFPAPSETRSLCAEAIETLAEYVRTHPEYQLEIKQVISGAKVPILILTNTLGHSIDVSINNELPIFNTRLLRAYAQTDERVRILVLCVKRWARLVGVTDAKSGNLSSYSWTLLCIYYLQVRNAREGGPLLPSLQQLAANQPENLFRDPCTGRSFDVRWVQDPRYKLTTCASTASELLRGFFTFYARDFQWGLEVASIRLAHRYPITNVRFNALARGKLAEPIHIEDPFDLQRNLNCVLDETGLAKLKNAFVDVARRVAEVPMTVLLQQARLLFYGRQVIPVRGFYNERVLGSSPSASDAERRVDLW
jgi:DNA polymerase sigma